MKLSYIYIIVLSAILLGCTDKYESATGFYPSLVPRYLSVTPNKFTIDAKDTDAKALNITSTDTPWMIDNSVDWISLSSQSGTSSASVQLHAKENTSGDESRLGIFYVRSDVSDWMHETTISVSQSNAKPFITPAKSEFDLPGTINEQYVEIDANCSWDIECSSEWIILVRDGEKVKFTTTANETLSYRSAVITITHTGIQNTSANITVRQAPASITASTESLSFDNTAGYASISITSEASWTASTASSWMDITPTSGNAGISILKIDVSPNLSTEDRTGYVIISIGADQRIKIPVKQRGVYIETDQSELSFAAVGGSLDFSVCSNTNWVVSSVPSWITVSPNQGEGNGTVKVTASENPNTANRSGSIHLTQTGLNVDVAVTVSQVGKTFDINTTVLNFDDKSSTQTINIQTDGTWAASANKSWITISPTTASGNSTLSVTVTENPGDNERSGQVEVVMADKSVTINVIQKGKYLTIDDTALSYTSKGGSIDITVSTNDAWTARIENNATWISASQMSGNGTAKISVVAVDNPSVNKRTGYVIIETIHGQSVRVQLTQSARYLTVNSQGLLFYSKGGTSEAIMVSSDGIYEIQPTQSWILITRSANTFVAKIDQNTTGISRFGSIIVRLTDLEEGNLSIEIPVTQLEDGQYFYREKYPQDVDYNIASGHNWSIKLVSYGSETDYNSSGTGGIDKDPTDEQGDINNGNTSGINKDSYNSETDYDN